MTKLKEKQNIPSGWREEKLLECLDVPSKLAGVKLSDYEKDGDFPVFDQGQDYISGYSSKKDLVIENVPAILFGDHTRVVKYIKSPFVAGADGTKIFWAKEGFDSTFMYYLVLSQKIPNTGYNRHFKFFKDIKVALPKSKTEQQKIAEVLGAVDEDIAKTQEVVDATEKLKKGLMQELLNRSNDLKVTKFSELVKLRNEKSKPNNDINEKYIGLEHIEQNAGNLISFGNSSDTKSINSVFKNSDILFGKLRPYLRKYWKAEFDGVCTSEILVFEPSLKTDTNFIFQLIQMDKFIQHSESKSFGTKMPRTDWKIISNFEIKLPLPERRKEIAEILSAVDEKISVNKKLKAKLTQLKKGLMQDLLSGEVRVKI